MRILHASDLHTNIKWYEWLRAAAKTYDLVCITGDLIGRRHDPNLKAQIIEVCSLLSDFPVPLAICSGNHDILTGTSDGSCDWFQRIKCPRNWRDGWRFEMYGNIFRCIPWGAPLREADAGEVWLCHNPPAQSVSGITRVERVDFGDYELAMLCKSGHGPALALCGHVHDPWRWYDQLGQTWVINTGNEPSGDWPSHHILDLDRDLITRRHPFAADVHLPIIRLGRHAR